MRFVAKHGRLGMALTHLAFGALGVSAMLKFSALEQFAADLLTWDLFPHRWVPSLSILIPVLEVGIAGAWFLALAPRAARLTYLVLLGGFTSALVLHLLVARPPSCGCFGAHFRFESARTGAWAGLVRNAVLAAMLCAGWVVSPGNRGVGGAVGDPGVPEVSLPHQARPLHRRAFSMIEMIVVIALIGVLVSLTLPLLTGARRASQVALSLSNLRQHGVTMTAYTGDNAESFPFLTDPAAYETIFRHGGAIARPQFFELHAVWNFPLADDYYGGDHRGGAFDMPYAPVSHASQYYYADCFIARPEFWNLRTRTGMDQWRGTRQSDVMFPALKGIVRERHSWNDLAAGRLVTPGPDDPWEPIRFVSVDGAARGVLSSAVLAPLPVGVEGPWPWRVSYLHHGVPIMHTIDGVRGRDVD